MMTYMPLARAQSTTLATSVMNAALIVPLVELKSQAHGTRRVLNPASAMLLISAWVGCAYPQVDSRVLPRLKPGVGMTWAAVDPTEGKARHAMAWQ